MHAPTSMPAAIAGGAARYPPRYASRLRKSMMSLYASTRAVSWAGSASCSLPGSLPMHRASDVKLQSQGAPPARFVR
eukprot:12902412-Prorocentrum_lima.AAC.1